MSETTSNKLTAKERMQILRHHMIEQEPDVRNKNFSEVNLGYTAEMAQKEAMRCIQCPKPTCVQGCPVNIDIRGFINQVAEGDFIGAVKTIKQDNALPAICGRVCPQEEQCEVVCVVGKKNEPVDTGNVL